MHNKQLHKSILISADLRRAVCEKHGGEVKKRHKFFVTNSQTKRQFTGPKGYLKQKQKYKKDRSLLFTVSL
jgi:hypothetical protein